MGWLDSRFVGCLVGSWFFMLVGTRFGGSLVGSLFCGLFCELVVWIFFYRLASWILILWVCWLDSRVVVCLVGSSFCGLVGWILVLWVFCLDPGFLVGWSYPRFVG